MAVKSSPPLFVSTTEPLRPVIVPPTVCGAGGEGNGGAGGAGFPTPLPPPPSPLHPPAKHRAKTTALERESSALIRPPLLPIFFPALETIGPDSRNCQLRERLPHRHHPVQPGETLAARRFQEVPDEGLPRHLGGGGPVQGAPQSVPADAARDHVLVVDAVLDPPVRPCRHAPPARGQPQARDRELGGPPLRAQARRLVQLS